MYGKAWLGGYRFEGQSRGLLDQIARAAEEERAARGEESVMPEPAGAPVVDYLAVSQAWKEKRGWMEQVKEEAEPFGFSNLTGRRDNA